MAVSIDQKLMNKIYIKNQFKYSFKDSWIMKNFSIGIDFDIYKKKTT